MVATLGTLSPDRGSPGLGVDVSCRVLLLAAAVGVLPGPWGQPPVRGGERVGGERLGAARSEAERTEGERVEFRQNGQQRTVIGKVLVEAQDGGILLEARDQVVWPLQPDEIVLREPYDGNASTLSADELASQILTELPAGFRVYKTAHYAICYNTTKLYAESCGALFERLHRAFTNYWSRRQVKLRDTPPLVACVFQDRKSYEDYGRGELGDAISAVIGYYSYKTNRIAMYDLMEHRQMRSANQINQFLRSRERTVATVIHEATHQLAFNSGIHQRFADIPLWFSEGLAIYFETPDLNSSRGWRTIGAVNQLRLGQFRRYETQRRSEDSLVSLIAADDRFRDTSLATDAYAESWAFCYFLIRSQPRQFARYVRLLQEKTPLDTDTPQQRLDDFRLAFEADPRELNDEFIKHLQRVH